MARGQIPLPAIEAAIGVLLLTTLILSVAIGVPTADSRQAQLDAYASDAGTLLAGTSPQHGDATRLAEVAASPESFEREQDVLRQRLGRILPANLLYQVRTPHGTVGFQQPRAVTVGRTTVHTVEGPVTIEVWYA